MATVEVDMRDKIIAFKGPSRLRHRGDECACLARRNGQPNGCAASRDARVLLPPRQAAAAIPETVAPAGGAGQPLARAPRDARARRSAERCRQRERLHAKRIHVTTFSVQLRGPRGLLVRSPPARGAVRRHPPFRRSSWAHPMAAGEAAHRATRRSREGHRTACFC